MNNQPFTRATIVGGQSFLGTSLVRALERGGSEVHLKSPGEVDWLDRLEGLVVLADPLGEGSSGTAAVLAEAVARGGYDALILVSTVRVYDGLVGRVDEETSLLVPERPEALGTLSVRCQEHIVRQRGGPRAFVVRMAETYGDGLDGGTFLEAMIERALEGRAGTVETAPDVQRDLIHVEDACRALLAIAARGTHSCYIVASGEAVDDRTLLGLLSERTKTRLEPGLPPTGNEAPSLDVSRLAELGVVPRRLADGLDRVLTWQDNQRAMRSMMGVTRMPWM